ncbi:TPA: helix-turn-helix domain-containing protein [Pseudomonas aeruginosa]|uniref:helix-turn-helix domain-containing protein n=1 Tax=Pseudomonas aeruginosa TaxID=287 RepID=UPI000CF601A3|nr:helix-turn-helix domain-containing protein [Pseudomonas aeruginosa]ELM7155239.1 helix-turn-helix domain-containing protein [Pseudomonas aeruginosa]MBI7367847.1 helix-turn-helix domain-containing protein [Pseudomonas aeruginosa]PQM05482.1 helix-turn-helix domain-containing protein [Pseudomonas aeruginosa]HEJ2076410.1 helix-turn-helix domain-containing protein [Pseudomonas aeruginosa]HEJ2285836.1 helix-turn-helix domain-containing protein [Pseudomonas aeruginosa]
MSVQAMTWALEQQVVTDAAMRHVLLCLANYANEAGKGAFPSIATLSSDTGLSERTVQYKLRSLEEAGVIRRGNQAIAAAYISHRDRLPMVYDLSMERGATVAPGANDDVTGCKPRRNGVQLTTQRGATVAPGANDDVTGCKPRRNGVQLTTQRGATVAPDPSLNHQRTTKEPKEHVQTGETGSDDVGDRKGKTESGKRPAKPNPLDGFEEFYQVYPKHKDRAKAEKAWRKIDPALHPVIMAALPKHCRQRDWLKDNGQFVPLPASWLNGRRWEDEIAPDAGPASSFTNLPKHTPDMYQDRDDGRANF